MERSFLGIGYRKSKIPHVEEEEEGLGRMPENLVSVSEFLLFNSQDNPYRKYTSLDNLMGLQRKEREMKARKQERNLGDAPDTILRGEELVRMPQTSPDEEHLCFRRA